MEAEELPLFELYTRLQESGLPLGVSEYAQALKALQAGFGVSDRQALERLCRALWVKSEEDNNTFTKCFVELFGSSQPPSDRISENINHQPYYSAWKIFIKKEKISLQAIRRKQIRIIIILILFGSAFVGIWLMQSKHRPSLPSETIPSPVGVPWELLIIGFLVGSILLGSAVYWFLIRRLTIFQSPESLGSSEGVTSMISQAEMSNINYDEIQLAEANRTTAESSQVFLRAKLFGEDEYFPLTRRQMKQGWRCLRRNSRVGPKIEFDIEATVSQIARNGLFLNPVMRASKINRTKLVLLLDQDGSMFPFHALSDRLVYTAVRAGRLGSTGTYYFHNCPVNYLYHDPLMQEPEPLSQFFKDRLSPNSVVMIVSDAGSARGGFNTNRIKKTKLFLTQLKRHSRHVVWLNPLPRCRWKNTSANEIANFIAMFEIDPPGGFRSAIDVLQGRWRPNIKALKVTLWEVGSPKI